LGPLATQHRVILAPVELEGLARSKSQWHERAPPGRPLFALLVCPPLTGKGGDPVVGPGVAKRDQVGVQLLCRPTLLARLAPFGLQPARQLLRKGVELAGPIRRRELRLDGAGAQILRDRVAR